MIYLSTYHRYCSKNGRRYYMVGTNDAIEKNSDYIITELMQLKWYVETVLPSCKVSLSCPTMRVDCEADCFQSSQKTYKSTCIINFQ